MPYIVQPQNFLNPALFSNGELPSVGARPSGEEISAGDVSFRLAPRMNAAGRMENARDVIDLLTLPDAARTREIAERLEHLNRERQRLVEEILRTIVAQIEQRVA